MTFSAKLQLSTTVPLEVWSQLDHTEGCGDVEKITTSLSPLVLFDSPREAVNVRDTATLMVHSVFAAVCAETDIIRSQENIFRTYAEKLVERISRGEDTGLAHGDVLTMWSLLSNDQHDEVVKELFDACRALEDFPDVATMNIAYTHINAIMDAELVDIPMFLPAAVATSTGVAGIIPSLDGVTWRQSAYTRVSYPYSRNITQWHVWDVKNRKVSAVHGDLFDDHLDSLSSLTFSP